MRPERNIWIVEAESMVIDAGKKWEEAAIALNEKYGAGSFTKPIVRNCVRRYGKRWASGERSSYGMSAEASQTEQKQIVRPAQSFKDEDKLNQDGSRESTKLLQMIVGKKYTPEELLVLHGFDPPENWELIECTSNAWNGMTGKKRNNELVELRQSKLRAKPRTRVLTLDDVKAVYQELATEYQHQAPCATYIKKQGAMLAEVNMADLHLGKLCWHGDTGNDYDHKIAREQWRDTVSDIYGQLHGKPIEKIVFIATNDFFNSDNPQRTTTAGTPQDTGIVWRKLYKVGITLLTDAISTFEGIAPVESKYTESNHDMQTMYYAVCHLDAFFRNDENVTIDTDAKARKYLLYGSTLLGFSHGDTERKQARSALGALASLPPIEARELWGKARYCEVHAAHLHCEQAVDEVNGVKVRRISGLTATDAWHYRSGYVGAVRTAQTFLYDKEYGLQQIIYTPVKA